MSYSNLGTIYAKGLWSLKKLMVIITPMLYCDFFTNKKSRYSLYNVCLM